MAFSENLTLDHLTVVGPSDKPQVQFDDPPGPSPARFVGPIHDKEKLLEDLTSDLGNQAYRVRIDGVYSGAFTGESYAIILFVLGGIAGGVLGAVGQDVWNAIKKAMAKALQRNGARRNVVEVAFEFEECDIILHAESRSAAQIPGMFDDADNALMQLKGELVERKSLPKGVEAIEVRADSQTGKRTHILYSYRRARLIMDELSKKPNSDKASGGDSDKEF